MEFGDLKPEAPPVFGYPLINYSPVNSMNLDVKDKSDMRWASISKVIYTSNKPKDTKNILITAMLAKHDDSQNNAHLIENAMTYGYKLENHGVNSETQ